VTIWWSGGVCREDILLSQLHSKIRGGVVVKLDELTVQDFVRELSSANPTPGGGSVAALCGALGAALSAMVSRLTVGNERFKKAWSSMEEGMGAADELSGRFLELVQEDSDAYQGVMAAFQLPQETDTQRSSREVAVEEAMKKAATVPLQTLRAAEKLIHLAREAVQQGNPNAITDAGAALQLAGTTAAVAEYNVRINLSRIKNEAFIAECEKEVDDTLKRIGALVADVEGNANIHLG
jgi:formiminotetrahydrofolate cyclodeaminase